MERTRIQKFIVVILILFIFLLATVFHFQIHFEDALTLMPAPDFGLSISPWRTIFEPILGPLLYYNRGLYALQELPLAFGWVLLFFMGFGLIKTFRKKTFSEKKIYIFGQLANLPLVLGICFAFFVLILFIPMPNNTIENNSKDKLLVTTHAHTEFSHDGLTSQENMWKWHKRNGFDAFFITDHANHQKSLEFANKQRERAFPMTPLVMVGQEYSGSNHMSLLGLNGKFDTKGMSDQKVIDTVHHYGGAVIVNHWFDGKGKEKELYAKMGADGFEIENAGKDLYYDRNLFNELKSYCQENGLSMIGGLDFHGYGKMCSMYNALTIPNWEQLKPREKEQQILEILKKGNQEKIQVLIYKDRPFYEKKNLGIRPFLTLINYFRTLNLNQVFSWALWLVLIQLICSKSKIRIGDSNKKIVYFSLIGALFLLSLGAIYYFRGMAVKGYSKVYSEYSGILLPIGSTLFLYAVVVLYFRYFRKGKNRVAS